MAWVERVEWRGRRAKFFEDDADSSRRRAVFTIHDQHYEDGGQWQDVDETMGADSSVTGFVASAKRMRHQVLFGAAGERRWIPRREYPAEYVTLARPQYWTGTAWANLNVGARAISGNVITFTRPNYQLRLTVTWRSLKFEYVLHNSNAPARIRFGFALNGLTWDGWALRGQDGAIVGAMPQPVAWDANGSIGEPNVPVTESVSGGYVELTVNAAGAAYPVTLDPTLTLQPDGSAGIDTYTYRAAADTSYATSNLLSLRGVGSTSAKVALLKFDLSSLAGTTITSGTLNLYVAGIVSASVSLALHRVLAANADWSKASTWNYRVPTSERWPGDSGGDGGANAGCSQAGTDYASTSMGSLTWPSGEAVGTEFSGSLSTSEMTTLVANNYGMALVSPYDTANLNVFSSDHTTAAYRPLLVVEYTAGGTAVELAGGAAGAAAVAGAVVIGRPLAGAAAGVADVAAAVAVGRALTGTAAGTASVAGQLTQVCGLTGIATGSAAVAGDMALLRALAAVATGTGSASGQLAIGRALAGAVMGAAAVDGALQRQIGLSGAAAGAATVQAELALLRALAGLVAGQSAAAGDLALSPSVVVALAGLIAAGAGVSGALGMGRAFSGATTAASEAAGQLALARGLAGATAGAGEVAGTLALARALNGSVAALADVRAELRREISLGGLSAGQATVLASLISGLLRYVYGAVSGPGRAGSVSGMGRSGGATGPGRTGSVRS